MRHVIAIDLGTSGPKVALVSERGELVAGAVRTVATHMLPESGAEQDCAEIWSGVCSGVRQVMSESGVPRDSIAAIACDSQYCSIVPVDAEGRATANLLLWLDGRGGPHALALHRRNPDAFQRWIEIHGIPPLPSGGDSLSKILWVRHERPEVWERTRCFVEPVDWLLARMTGRLTANVCTAFMLLLTDSERIDLLDWHPELLAMSGMDPAKLPELLPPNAEIGTLRPAIADELGLPASVKVLSGVNDTQAAAVATATFRPGGGAVNVGTTGQVLAHLDSRKIDFANSLVSMPSPLAGRHMLMAENGIAARALDHFLRSIVFARDGIADHGVGADPFAGLEREVESTPAGARRLLFLPWLTGTVAPDGNPRARGAFVNISLETDRACMVRAILEGVGFSLRGLLPAVEVLTGATFAELRFSGGGARSDAWAQILADVLARPILPLADAVHSNNRASALLAFDALGLAGLEEVDRFCPTRARFEPRRENVPIYDELFTQFRAAYDGLRPVFDELNSVREKRT